MGALADRPFLHRVVGALVAVVSVGLLALVASAAIQPRVDNPHGKFKADCQQCHSAKGWKQVKVSSKFDHGKYGFPLSGAHATANCMGCHTSLDFAQSKTQCASCHQDPHRSEMGTNCSRCHSSRSFQDRGPMVRAHQLSRFPLTGSHATLDCESCHKPAAQGQMQFIGTSAECYSCHKAQYDAAPNHKSTGRSTECQTCHTPISWSNVNNFDHAAAGFALTGQHSTSVRQCDDCHHGSYASISKDCYSCHATTYASATPAHNPTSFPTATSNCTGCHSQAAANHITWAGANNFDHAAVGFPLTGQHSTSVRQCDDCHHGSYVSLSKDCYSCHATTYASATPTHNPTSFPTATSNCTGCHSQAAANHITWAGANNFDHAAAGFPLTGLHSTSVRQCDDCHHGSYTNMSQACSSCHTTSTPGYNNTGPGNPVHNATYFPTSQCTTCHASAASSHTTWQGGVYTHSQMQLTNAHSGRACEDCHKGNYSSVAYNCYGCHQNSSPGYANATNPPHSPVNFPTTNAGCTGCHNTVAFSPSTFNHGSTAFPLTGAHLAQACTACHNAATWNTLGTGNNCYGCHSADYASTSNLAGVPPHDPVNFPQAGCVCHNTTSWLGATAFDHASVGFSMTGSHSLAARQCSDCHSIIGYTAGATDKDCYTCHATSYTSNGVVKHTTPNFPTTTAQCITCHAAANTNHVTWNNGVFSNHAGVTTNFALTGNHAGFQCSDCHTAAGTDLKQYTCSVTCHAGSNNFGTGGSRHSQNASRGGYTFSVVVRVETIKECYICHGNGRG
jgi:hypothetical protein